MQKRIESLSEDACVLYAIANEPQITPVHPEGTIDRNPEALEEGIEAAEQRDTAGIDDILNDIAE